jgi:hypothetical protein
MTRTASLNFVRVKPPLAEFKTRGSEVEPWLNLEMPWSAAVRGRAILTASHRLEISIVKDPERLT